MKMSSQIETKQWKIYIKCGTFVDINDLHANTHSK